MCFPAAHVLGALVAMTVGTAAPVRWSAPAECPDEAEVVQRLDGLLEESGSGTRAAIELDMVVLAVDGGFALTVTMTGEDGSTGTRNLIAPRCEDLTTAAVLIAGLAIDPALSVPDSPETPRDDPETPDDAIEPAVPAAPEPAPEPTRTPAPAPTPSADAREPTDAAPLRDPSPVAAVVVTSLGASLGRLAGPAGMLRIGGGIETLGAPIAFRALVRATGVGPSFGEVDGSGGVFGAALVGLAGCGVIPFGTRWAAIGCVGSDVGIALARGRGIDNARSARAVWWGVDGELGLEVDVSRRVALTLLGEGGGVLAAPSFVVDGRGRVCCNRWSASARAGVRVRWGAPRDRRG